MKHPIDIEFSNHVERLLADDDNTKLFTAGCCFHFALRLHFDRQIPFIEGCWDRDENVPGRYHHPHVWLAVNDLAFDATGVYGRVLFREQMKPRFSVTNVSGLDVKSMLQKIEAKRLPSHMLKVLNARALYFFDTDPRFDPVKQRRGPKLQTSPRPTVESPATINPK
jgi:hypothetical protein